jgi:hypothetical protein
VCAYCAVRFLEKETFHRQGSHTSATIRLLKGPLKNACWDDCRGNFASSLRVLPKMALSAVKAAMVTSGCHEVAGRVEFLARSCKRDRNRTCELTRDELRPLFANLKYLLRLEGKAVPSLWFFRSYGSLFVRPTGRVAILAGAVSLLTLQVCNE